MYNTIIIYTQLSQDAERILKHAERVLRYSWNLYGFQRINSGHNIVITDGFGNPYDNERELRLFGIAIKVPDCMDYRMVMAYLKCGNTMVGCYAEYHYTNI